MTDRQFSDALDRCLTLLTEEGATVEECLARYPRHAAELRPLLEMALELRRMPPKVPTPSAVVAGRHRMLAALTEKSRRQSVEVGPASQPGLLSRLKQRLEPWLTGEGGAGWRVTPGLRTALTAASVLLLIVVGALLLPSWLQPDMVQMATLERPIGAVEVQPASGDGWVPAAAGQSLDVGVRIRTGALSAARLSFFDGSVTVLEADTEIAVKSLVAEADGGATTILLEQPRGRTHHRVTPMSNPESRFEVRSPLAVTAVRGTEFVVTVDDDGTTDVIVRTGLVEVQVDLETIQLEPGWATSVRPSQPPAAPYSAPLPPALEELPILRQELAETTTATSTASRTSDSTATSMPSPVPSDTPQPGPTAESDQSQEIKPTKTTEPLPTLTRVRATATPTPTATRDEEGPPTQRPELTPTDRPTSTVTPTPDDDVPPTQRPESTSTPIPEPTSTPNPSSTPDPDAPPTQRPESTPTPDASEATSGQSGLTALPTVTPSSERPAQKKDRDGTEQDGDSLVVLGAGEPGSEDRRETGDDVSALRPVGGATMGRSALQLLGPWIAAVIVLGLFGLGVGIFAYGRSGT